MSTVEKLRKRSEVLWEESMNTDSERETRELLRDAVNLLDDLIIAIDEQYVPISDFQSLVELYNR